MKTFLGVAAGQPAPQTTAVAHLESSSYVDFGNSLSGISFLGASPYCFEGWFQFHGLCPDTTLLQKAGEFTLGTSGRKVYVQRTGQPAALMSPDVLVSDDWIHIAVSFDGSTLSLYVNGLLQSSTSTPGPGIDDQGADFELGVGFQGYVDSFRIWSTNRSAAQIYDAEWVSAAGSYGLVAEYDFSVIPPVDRSGNNHPIVYENGAASMSLTRAVDVLGFGYCEPVHEETDVNPGGGGSDAYSIVAWVNLKTTSGAQAIFTNGDISTDSGIYLYVQDGTVYARRGGTSSANLASTSTIAAAQWVCVAYTYDGTTQTLYIDGAAAGSAAGTAIPSMAESHLVLGAAYSSESGVMLMNMQGFIQFVSVWSKALTATEVAAAMYDDPTDKPGCVANYSFAVDSATDLQTGNPIAMAQGAKLTVLSAMATGRDAAQFSRRTARPPIAGASDDLTDEQIAARRAFYTPERIAACVAEFVRAIPPTWTRAERLSRTAELRRTLERIAAGESVPGSVRGVRYEIAVDGGHRTVTRISRRGREVLYRGAADELTPCQAAQITFLVATFDLFLGLFGLVIETSVAQRFFGIRIGEGGFATALQAIFSLPLTPTSVLKVIAILWDFGWFSSLIVLVINGLTWWDWVTLAARVAFMIVPYPTAQKVYAIAELAIGIWELVEAFNTVDSTCYSRLQLAST